MTYRKARDSDLETIVEFQLRMADETEGIALERETCIQGVRAVLHNPTLGQYYLGEVDSMIAGSLLITYEWSDWRNGLVWWIQSVYVGQTFRNQGVYSGLYRHVKGLAEADSKVRGIRLYVDRRNAAAQEVYRRLGMNGDHYQVFEWMK